MKSCPRDRLWEQSSPLEQLLLAAVTGLVAQMPAATVTEIIALLDERGISQEEQAVREAIKRLTDRDIFREAAEQPPRYDFKVDLVRLWVTRYKSLGRVVEEVG